MDILYILVPIAVLLTLLASALYVWAVSSGQYDDLDKDAESILFDEVAHHANTIHNHNKARVSTPPEKND